MEYWCYNTKTGKLVRIVVEHWQDELDIAWMAWTKKHFIIFQAELVAA